MKKVKMLKAVGSRKKGEVVEVDALRAEAWESDGSAKEVK